jgi:hypothetical protein
MTNRPELLVIGGHVRSGTTMLMRLCDSHPDIAMTMEFRLFAGLDRPWKAYRKALRGRDFDRRPAYARHYDNRRFAGIKSRILRWRVLLGLLPAYRRVTLPALRRSLRLAFPRAKIVGDKTPDYIRTTGRWVDYDLLRVMIYRDPRDVAQSTIRLLQGSWAGQPYYKGWDERTVATNWVQWVDLIESHADRILAVKYEDLVANPGAEANRIAAYLGVDPAGFRISLVRGSSVGKFRTALSSEQVANIVEIAGPTMERLGYELS